jgi:hypothetical protein
MTSISVEIIDKLFRRILEQEVINQALCELIVESGLITKDELEFKINNNIDFVNNTYKSLKPIPKKEKEEVEMLPYYGDIGEA